MCIYKHISIYTYIYICIYICRYRAASSEISIAEAGLIDLAMAPEPTDEQALAAWETFGKAISNRGEVKVLRRIADRHDDDTVVEAILKMAAVLCSTACAMRLAEIHDG